MVLGWFTGLIGVYRVHYLNEGIPLDRLDEAKNAIPAAQQPSATALRPSDTVACFRLMNCDEANQEVISCNQAHAVA